MESEKKTKDQHREDLPDEKKQGASDDHKDREVQGEGGPGPGSSSEDVKDEESQKEGQEDLDEKIAILSSERDEWKKKAEALKDLYLRERAEMENYRKRLERESEERVFREKAEFVKGLLEVIDNFEYFLLAASRKKKQPASEGEKEQTPVSSEAKEFSAFLKGVTMIHQGFLRFLAREGITPLDASPGTKFDPRYHEAVDAEELGEEHGAITQEIRKGYLLNDKLLRPARVKVAR